MAESDRINGEAKRKEVRHRPHAANRLYHREFIRLRKRPSGNTAQETIRQMTEETINDPAENKAETSTETPKTKRRPLEIDPELIKRIKETLEIPLPEKSPFWRIEGLPDTKKGDRKILGIFKKKTLGIDEINDLRKSALQSPGNTRTKIAKLKKQYPDNPMLYMLSAICTHGMLLNSANHREVLKGLKIATKEGAIALTSNGISVYNCENFFRIYFTYLDRLKRALVRNYEEVVQDPRLDSYRQQLMNAMQIADQLTGEKSKVFNILNFLKKKLKSSQYTINISFHSLREAIRKIELGNPKEKLTMGTAGEMIAYIYALCVGFARIPILWLLVDEVTRIFPDSNKALLVRKISIHSVRNFTRFKLAVIESDREKMAKIGKTIMKDNILGIQKLDGQSLYQSYETDPFFNLAFVAEMTAGLYRDDDHKKIVETALQAVETVIKRDMSKDHIFTESANNHSHKLVALRDGAPKNPEDQV
jgi:hypothetical protein